jgi:hypothetical protein
MTHPSFVLEIRRFIEDPNGIEETPPLNTHWELVGIYDKKSLINHLNTGLPIPENPTGKYWPASSYEKGVPGEIFVSTGQTYYRIRELFYWKNL